MEKTKEENSNPMVIADHLWNSTNPMVTSCMDKKSYQIGAMEAVKYMRNHPESTPCTALPKEDDGWKDAKKGYEINKPYLVFGENWPYSEVCSYWDTPGDSGWHDSNGELCYNVTHYRKLPTPPQTKEG